MNAKKISANKYEKVVKERGEERMSLNSLESYRMTLMDICSRVDEMEQEKEKMSKLRNNISKAKDAIGHVKSENGRRYNKMR